MRIYVDMDGVLFNFVKQVAPLLDTTEEELSRKLFLHQTYSIPQALGIGSINMNRAINDQGTEFWEKMEPYKWAYDLLIDIQGIEDSRVYIASDPGFFLYSHMGKVECLKDHFGLAFKNYVFTPYKHLLADKNSILIDDNRDNISAFQREGGYGILFPQPWNSKKAEEYNVDKIEYTINKVKEHAKEITS